MSTTPVRAEGQTYERFELAPRARARVWSERSRGAPWRSARLGPLPLTLFVTVPGVILLWLRPARDVRNLDNQRRRAA